ncbi:hypothetical protein BN439_0864 [Erwinia amylovora Ea644]|nr:hypothetical protein BN439_0864 [Erwinia amylovora Ea644]
MSYHVILQKPILARLKSAWPVGPVIGKFLPQDAPAAASCFASLQLEVCDV